MITRDPEIAAQLADRVVRIEDGRVQLRDKTKTKGKRGRALVLPRFK